MARKQGGTRFGTTAVALLGCVAALGIGGCSLLKSPVTAEKPHVEKREATRPELLALLAEQMNRFHTLSAATRFSVALQDRVVPATMADYVYMQSGRPYRKKFIQTEVEGQLLLVRESNGDRKVRVSGTIEGSGNFMLLGKNDSFWILEPTTEQERNEAITQGQSAPHGRASYGTLEAAAMRPKGEISIRPQDIADLLLTDEVYSVGKVMDRCYVEKWPDYYVINFLRQSQPELIYSKVWIERDGLTVAIHQLYDGNGEVVAEGRFRNYASYSGQDSKLRIEIPSVVDFLWPRDKIVLHAELSSTNTRVNEPIPEKYFDEKALLKGYPKPQPLHGLPAAPKPSH